MTIKPKLPSQFQSSDGEKYTILTTDGLTGLDYVLRIFDLLNNNSNQPVNPQVLAQGIIQASSSSSPFVDKAKDLIIDLMSLVLHNNKTITKEYFASHFTGRYFQIYEILMEVIIVNGFFDLIGAPLMAMMEQPQEPVKTKSAKTSKKGGLSTV